MTHSQVILRTKQLSLQNNLFLQLLMSLLLQLGADLIPQVCHTLQALKHTQITECMAKVGQCNQVGLLHLTEQCHKDESLHPSEDIVAWVAGVPFYSHQDHLAREFCYTLMLGKFAMLLLLCYECHKKLGQM